MGCFLILRAQNMNLRYDPEGTGVTTVGISAIVFAQVSHACLFFLMMMRMMMNTVIS